jgi:hypothetical protein
MKIPFHTALVFALLLGASTTPAFGSGPTPLPEQPDASVGYDSPEAALAALRARPDVTIREEAGWIMASDVKSSALWTFTTPGNDAHPAVVKRTIVEHDGGLSVQMDVLCGGSKEACDQLVRDFQVLNEKMKQELGGNAAQ